MKKRRMGSAAGRAALVHAIAHIELNAIDLAWDMIARFGNKAAIEEGFGTPFISDWVGVADDEARHFLMLRDRLQALNTEYGDFPAHDGLWEAAHNTRDDLLARLAVVPMVLEARGLDVTPTMIEGMKRAGDVATSKVLETIYQDEIGHVAVGTRWFTALCARRGLDPIPTFRTIITRDFKGSLKPPFNNEARQAAGLTPAFYQPADR